MSEVRENGFGREVGDTGARTFKPGKHNNSRLDKNAEDTGPTLE